MTGKFIAVVPGKLLRIGTSGVFVEFLTNVVAGRLTFRLFGEIRDYDMTSTEYTVTINKVTPEGAIDVGVIIQKLNKIISGTKRRSDELRVEAKAAERRLKGCIKATQACMDASAELIQMGSPFSSIRTSDGSN